MESFNPSNSVVLNGALPIKNLYGKFPEFIELMAIIRNIYGEDFMEIFETSFHNIETEFIEENGNVKKLPTESESLSNF